MKKLIISRMKKPGKMRSEQYILLAFGALILLGSILLTLPVASRSGESSGFLTALFTATSATCVTGLALVDTYTQWSLFGQIVIICLIQVGGLGFMTAVSVFFFLLNRKIGLKQRLIMAQAFSLNEIDGVVSLVKNVLKGTLLMEGAGAAILTVRFMGEYDFWRALRWGIFHSISAFCNAGFDIFGYLEPGSSLILFAKDPVVNFTIMALIVVGGLGFYVWTDMKRAKKFKELSVYSKLVLSITVVLIFGGALVVALFEWNNPATIGHFTLWEKVMASLFQSVTCRTAGFATLNQAMLTEGSKAFSLLLMIIGGSSGSTAGGIKTVTFGLVALAILSYARGRSRLTVFHRTINNRQIQQGLTITMLMMALSFFGAIMLTQFNGFSFMDSLFETVSALGTVGLSTGITGHLNMASQIMIIIFMFFGRVGIMTFSFGFLLRNEAEERYHYAEAKVLIG
ncbi:MAG: potassium transporter TrkG [Eubacteriales bacterium]